MREIDFFRTRSGDFPVKQFLDSLSSKRAQKVAWVLQLIEDIEKVPKQYFKKLVNTNNIWEVRVQLGADIFRILGFFVNMNKFIATNGFQKKTQKTPQREIDMAEKRKDEYFNKRGK